MENAMNLFTLNNLILLLTGLVAIYLLWRFWGRYSVQKGLYDMYYMMGFLVLLIAGLLLIFLGYDILGTPFVLSVASLIPLGISIGIIEQFFPSWKKAYKWFATIGILAIIVTSFASGLEPLRKIAVPLFHSVAGLVIFLGPFLAKDAPKGYFWVGIGGVLIGLGGIALAFLTAGSQLLFFSQSFVLLILAPLLFLMSLAFAYGFLKDINSTKRSLGSI
jgi:hypothetical protein